MLDEGYCLDPPNTVVMCPDNCGDGVIDTDKGEECDPDGVGCTGCKLDSGYCLD